MCLPFSISSALLVKSISGDLHADLAGLGLQLKLKSPRLLAFDTRLNSSDEHALGVAVIFVSSPLAGSEPSA